MTPTRSQAINHKSDLGMLLRHGRQERGWSLQDVEAQTRIRTRVLHQLEANDFTGPLSGPYGRSFLFQYADHLGIDIVDALNLIEAKEGFKNLDSYEYLKDHDDFVPGAPIGYWVDPREAEEEVECEPVSRLRSRAAAPVLAALLTIALITTAFLGYMRLDRGFSEIGDEQSRSSREETLAPMGGIPDTSPLRIGASRAGPLISTNSKPDPENEARREFVAGSRRESTALASAGPSTSAVTSPRNVSTVQTSAQAPNQPPPRAIIVEE